MKGLRIAEFLRDYDRTKTGTLSRADFNRAINHAGIKLGAQDSLLLASHFQDQERRDRVRWRDFERAVDESMLFTFIGYLLNPNV
jgi:hypothetical protein